MNHEQELAALRTNLLRYSNPWTIQIHHTNGTWSELCHDAPITLQEAEAREESLKVENPDARFRVVPWLNIDQRNGVRAEVAGMKLEIERLTRERELSDLRASEGCKQVLYALAGAHVCTPLEGYGSDVGWAISDLIRAHTAALSRTSEALTRATAAEAKVTELERELEKSQKEANRFEQLYIGESVDRSRAETKIADLTSRLSIARQALESLRRYVAVEGRPDEDSKLMIGLAWDGHIWGPYYDPSYEPWEFAENVEKWLHEKCDAALAQIADPAVPVVEPHPTAEEAAPPFRVGKKLGTTIYRNGESEPCAWVAGDPDLAAQIVRLLNGPNADPARPVARKSASNSKSRKFAIAAHGEQKYGNHPYRYHLDAVFCILHEFGFFAPQRLIDAGYLHDVLEDTTVTFADLEHEFGISTAALVYAVTDEPGVNRKERKAKTYPKIAAKPEAVTVKLADRIANVRECVQTNQSEKLQMYREEYPEFRKALRQSYGLNRFNSQMWDELDRLCLWLPAQAGARQEEQ